MDTTDHNDWSHSAMVELSVANIVFRGNTPAPASPPRSSTSCEARPVLSEYLTFPPQGSLATRRNAAFHISLFPSLVPLKAGRDKFINGLIVKLPVCRLVVFMVGTRNNHIGPVKIHPSTNYRDLPDTPRVFDVWRA